MMKNFDSSKVLERILQEVPILSNRRGEVEVTNPVYNNKGELIREKKEKRVIYAFYFNRGVPDPDLKYDRKANPLPTTPDSTLCEIYSHFEGDPDVKEWREEAIKTGYIKEGEVVNQGPWLEDCGFVDNPPLAARDGDQYQFWHSGHVFADHFNTICESLGFEPRIVDIDGMDHNYCIQISGQAALNFSGKTSHHDIAIKMRIGINFDREDPTLSRALGAISKAYEKLYIRDFSLPELYLE